MGSRHIIKTALQQLTDAGLISMKETKTVQSVDGDQEIILRTNIDCIWSKTTG